MCVISTGLVEAKDSSYNILMQQFRAFRVTGDSLSCWFSPTGSLSSARLFVEDKEYDVIHQLPGLRSSNVEEYLAELGYTSHHSKDCISVGSMLNELLRSSSLFVEAAHPTERGYLISVVKESDRSKACPVRAFVATCDDQLSSFDLFAIHDYKMSTQFLSRVN